MKVINGVYSGVTTSELDTLAAETAASMTTKHPDYGVLAARVAVSNLHKETEKCFSGWLLWLHMYYTPFLIISIISVVMQKLHLYVNAKSKRVCPMISADTNGIIQRNADVSTC